LIRSKPHEQGFAEVAGFFRRRKNIDIRMGPRTAKRAGRTVFFNGWGRSAPRTEGGWMIADSNAERGEAGGLAACVGFLRRGVTTDGH
jgi:hypothetical protein